LELRYFPDQDDGRVLGKFEANEKYRGYTQEKINRMIKKFKMLGFDFYSANDVGQIADLVYTDRYDENPEIYPLLVTPNVDHIVKLERKENLSLKRELKKARWILPDGQPIVTLSKIKYGREGLKARLTGSDFFPKYWRLLKDDEKAKVFFVLPHEELGRRFQSEKPNTRYYAPPFFQLDNRDEFEEVMSNVMEVFDQDPPSHVFIGLGFPKQEYVALEMFRRLSLADKKLPVTFLLGASFEFYWGTKKRAPKIFQKLGIEFFFRFLQEPRRMGKRLFIDDIAFIKIALSELMRKEPKGS
jgi:N-acetylglucosaminyldiphosphoundecaprenol N-acetyl-beta-D-mannosaminyltransferase